MKILIVEDSNDKFQAVMTSMTNAFPAFKQEFYRSESLHDYVRKVNSEKFDLIVFDILLPRRDGEESIDLSLDLIEETSGTRNASTAAVALTQMISPEYDTLVRFNEKGIPVLFYRDGEDNDLAGIVKLASSLNDVSRVDFIIVCALEKEAGAFESTDMKLGNWKAGLGASMCRRAEISNLKGFLFVLPAVGLTNAALLTAKVVEKYRPRVVAMSGICAGMPGDCKFTDVIVAELAWDYQVGKFTEAGFKQEVYQEAVDPHLISKLKHHVKTSSLSEKLRSTVLNGTKGVYSPEILFGPMASGSAVVADKAVVEKIEGQQRKVLGIEMEIAAVFAACRFSSVEPLFFAAKGVVDFADKEKSDIAHEWGSKASAIVVTELLCIALS